METGQYPRATPEGRDLGELELVEAIPIPAAPTATTGWLSVEGVLARLGITCGPDGTTTVRHLRIHVVRALGHAGARTGRTGRAAAWSVDHVDAHAADVRARLTRPASAERAARIRAVQPRSVGDSAEMARRAAAGATSGAVMAERARSRWAR